MIRFLTNGNGKAARVAVLLGCAGILSLVLAGVFPVGGWMNDVAAFGIVVSVVISAWLSTKQRSSAAANG